MKYKVGDLVKVREWNDLTSEFKVMDEECCKDFKKPELFIGQIIHEGSDFGPKFSRKKELCGQLIKIKEIKNNRYLMENINGNWQDWMLEDMNKIKIKLIMKDLL